ncbi:MAG: hypothetical protein AAF449_16830 [Myxococcota bacterium]
MIGRIGKIAMVATATLSLIAGSTEAQAVGEPDPVNAVILSTAGTAVPIAVAAGLLATGDGAKEGMRFDVARALVAMGAVIGPSVGQFYAKGGTNAWVTLGLRLATAVPMTAGLTLKLRGMPEDQTLGDALFWAGLVPTALLGLYDIVTALSTARASKYRDAQVARLGLTPELIEIARCGPMPCLSRGERL